MWGQIIGAVAPALLGGMLQNRDNQKAREYAKANQGVNYMKLRNDAQKAGFNPLTALMAGGSAAYQNDSGPALSTSSFIAEALSRGVETGFNIVNEQRDRERERIDEIERERRREESEMRLMAASSRLNFGYAPSNTTLALSAASGAPALASPADAPANGPRGPVYTASGQLRPRNDPMRERVLVFRADGSTPAHILRSTAERLGIQERATLTVGEETEISGEIAEFYNAGMMAEEAITGRGPDSAQYGNGPIGSTNGVIPNVRQGLPWLLTPGWGTGW